MIPHRLEPTAGEPILFISRPNEICGTAGPKQCCSVGPEIRTISVGGSDMYGTTWDQHMDVESNEMDK